MKVALALGAAAALVLLPGASAAGVFSDPIGDQVDKENLIGPDITMVEVDHTPSVVGVRVTIGNYPAMPPSSRLVILFDLDKDIATGDQGFEHAVNYDVDASGSSRVTFERFEPSRFSLVEVPGSTVSAEFAGGALTALVPRSELRTGTDLAFGVYAVRFGADRREVAGDVAPNANLWLYELVERTTFRLAASAFVVSPRRPLAGKQFSISSVVTRADTGTRVGRGSVSCRVRVGNDALRARGSFRGRSARCTMAIPRTATGKRLTGSMTVRAHGTAVTKRFSFRVA
jgi:hypothetical protein